MSEAVHLNDFQYKSKRWETLNVHNVSQTPPESQMHLIEGPNDLFRHATTLWDSQEGSFLLLLFITLEPRVE